MENPAVAFESLMEKVETYGKTTIELSKLKLLETSSTVIPNLITRLAVIFMIFIFVLVLNIGIALLLGEALGKSYYGFFIVAAFYLIAGLIVHFFLQGWIKKPVKDFIISQILQ